MPSKRYLEDDDDESVASTSQATQSRAKRSRVSQAPQMSAEERKQILERRRLDDLREKEHMDEILDVEGRPGIIEKIVLKNFMCHTYLEIELSPNVNFIIGRNGSGKSAVMAALTVGLGGRARDTSRGASIKTFIKTDKPFAEVAITLTNIGEDAFRADAYGERITVERRITQTSSSYKLKSSAGTTISTKSDEVSRMLDHFNIQVDNPVCMLNQDTSRNFLFSKKPEDKYKFFLKATELEKMGEEYEEAKKSHEEAEQYLKNKKETMPKLEAELKIWEKKAKAFTSIDDLKAKAHDMRNELLWAMVQEQEKILQMLEKDIEGEQAARPNFVKKIEAAENEHKKAQENKKEMESKMSDVTSKRDEYDTKLKELGGDRTRLMGEKRQADNKLRTVDREIHQLQRDMKLLDDRIRSILEQNNKDFSEEKRKREEQISQLEMQMAEIKAQVATTEHQLDQFNRAITKLKEDGFNWQREHTERSTQIRNIQMEIRKMEASKSDQWARFGEWVVKAKREIQTAMRQGKFKEEPKGPVGAYIKLKDEQYALSLEQCLGGMMTSWLCDNTKDHQLLEKILKKHANRMPNMAVTRFLDQPHNISCNQADTTRFRGMFDLIEVEDVVIFNYLVDQRSVENVLFILESDEARPIMQHNPPRNCKECFTQSGDQIYAGGPGGNYRYYSAEANVRVRYLVKDNQAALDAMNQELQRMQAELEGVNENMRSVQREIDGNKKHQYTYDQQMRRHQSTLGRLTTQWTDLRAIEDPMPIDVTTLQEDLENFRSDLNSKEQEKQRFTEDCADLLSKSDEAQKAFDMVKRQLDNYMSNSENEVSEFNKLLHSLPQLKKNIDHYKTKLSEFDVRLSEKIEASDKQKELVEDRLTKASSICERIRTKRNTKSLQAEITKLQERIATEEERHGDKEIVLATFKEKKAHVDMIRAKVDNLTKFVTLFTEIMDNRMGNVQQFKKMLAQRTRAYFACMLEQRQYRGHLKFDHDNQVLDLHVQPQADASQQNDMRQLSGGERSFSTVCFILALWDSMESPFRCLDEFDVFMDNVNRAISMQMMVNTTEKHKNQQFIFLTPLDMSHMKDKEGLKIFQMPAPER